VQTGEATTGQERALQIVMGSFDQPSRFRVGRLADQHLGRERAAKGLALGGELHPAATPAPDRTLPVPNQHPRHRPQRGDQLPPGPPTGLQWCGSGSAAPTTSASSR
jgi:hypothetical protein